MAVAVIRGGTSRGVFFREADLSGTASEREAAILRAFGGGDGAGILADGLGGENPVLRKVAIVGSAPPAADGIPRLRYTFGQVDERLGAVSHVAECGNIASGVPLFASLVGWCPGFTSAGAAWVELVNTGKRVFAEWPAGRATGGAIRLSFVDPSPPSPQAALPMGEPLSRIEGGKNGSAVRCTVVDAVNRYLFIASEDVGAPDPLAPAATAPETFDIVDALVATVTARLRARGSDGATLKVCLVQASSPDNSIRARILYPDGRRSHPSFAVTGAVAVAVAASMPGTLLHVRQSQLAVTHPEGDLPVAWTARPDGLPARVGIDRTCRLILRGSLY